MAELFILAVLGHLIGDFLLQSKRTALGKAERTWLGWQLCTVHVALYTAVVCGMLQTLSPLVWSAVFVPHWLIDRYSLADKWLAMIGGRTFKSAHESRELYREFNIAFTCVVYTVVDATFHLLSLWAVTKWLL